MENQQITDPIQAARAMFPTEYEPITQEFLDLYDEPIQELKQHYAATGGIVHLEVDEMGGIFRIPTKRMLDDLPKQTKNMSGIDADLFLVAQCAIYPSGQIIRRWVDSGYPGIAGAFARGLMEEARVAVEATRKKL